MVEQVPTVQLIGIPIHALTMTQAVATCLTAVGRREALTVGMVNAAKIVSMRRDPTLRRAVTECDLVLADGQSIVWASRLLRGRLPERVAGIDLFTELLDKGSAGALSAYFLGASPEVLRTMLEKIRAEYPGIRVVGSRDGYFPVEEDAAVVAEIATASPDLLFVGMSSPRKELFLAQNHDTLGAVVRHGVGGSFDVLAGHTKRAPGVWQDLGLEWLYRVRQEPRRLWRRYLTTNVAFVWLVALELLHRRTPVGVEWVIDKASEMPTDLVDEEWAA